MDFVSYVFYAQTKGTKTHKVNTFTRGTETCAALQKAERVIVL